MIKININCNMQYQYKYKQSYEYNYVTIVITILHVFFAPMVYIPIKIKPINPKIAYVATKPLFIVYTL